MDKEFKNDLDINSFITEIVEKIYNSREQLSKAISRFLPVDLAMKAKFELFKEKAPGIINKYFNNEENNGKTVKIKYFYFIF
jgi:hypothetical protein